MRRIAGISAILVLAIALSFFNHRGIAPSDEYLYSFHAWQITTGDFELSPSAFHNRFGQLLPMAFFIWLFGGHPYVLTLWSLLSFLLLLVGLWVLLRKKGSWLPWAAIGLIALNPSLLRLAADVSHDLVATAFSTLAVFLVWRLRRAPYPKPLPSALLFSSFLIWAMLTKLSALIVLPFLAWIAATDLRQGRHLRFWSISLGVGVLFLLGYLAGYAWFTGDPWYRWHGIEGEHNVSPWSYYGRSGSEILERLTYHPLAFFLATPGIGLPLLFSIGGMTFGKPGRTDRLLDFSFTYLLWLLVFHWFGSSSLQSYNPMLLAERMWLMLIPPATIMAVLFFQRLAEQDAPHKSRLVSLLLLAALAAAAGWTFYGEERPAFGFSAITLAVISSALFAGWEGRRLTALIMMAFLIGQVPNIVHFREQTSFFGERSFFQGLPKGRANWVVVDSIFITKPLAHFDFRPPAQLHLIDWNHPVELQETRPDSLFLLIDRYRAGIMTDYFKRPLPTGVTDPSGRRLVGNEHFSIYRISAETYERQFVRPAKNQRSD